MFKRIMSVFISAVILLVSASLCLTVSAESVQELLETAPQDMYFNFEYPNEGSERITVTYLIPTQLCSFATLSADKQKELYGMSGACYIQFDTSTDDDSNWGYTEQWNTVGASPLFQQTGPDFISPVAFELLWLTYAQTAQQYSQCVKEAVNEYDETFRVFDFEAHTLNVRARFAVENSETGETSFSEWSDSFCVNDFVGSKHEFDCNVKNLDEIKIENPTFGPDGEVYFNMSFSEKTVKAAWELKKATGFDAALVASVRISDGEWQDWSIADELYPYGVGARYFWLNEGYGGEKLEFRCRLYNPADDINGIPEIATQWSKTITAENGEIELKAAIKGSSPGSPSSASSGECEFCHVCSKPLGLCTFVWLFIALVCIIIALVVVRAVKKNKVRTQEINKAASERMEKSKASDEALRQAMKEKAGGAKSAETQPQDDEDKKDTEETEQSDDENKD